MDKRLVGQETLLKIGLYFRSMDAYHFASSQDPSLLKVETGPLKRWYMDETFHVQRGHWPDFDSRGLPWRRTHGLGYHRHETLSTWGFGQWDLYLLTADASHLQNVLDACDYHLETVDRSDPACWLLRDEVPGEGHVGGSSGLTHGQAIGLLARAFQVTGRDEYLELAVKLLDYLERPMSRGGALGEVPETGTIWFEEEPEPPPRHILNGMIIILWGLHDFGVVADSPRAHGLWEQGVDSVRRALPRFDTGSWSWYYISDKVQPYVASAKYHGCHIVQLQILHEMTGEATFEAYARRFASYADSLSCRARAAAQMVRAKSSGQATRLLGLR